LVIVWSRLKIKLNKDKVYFDVVTFNVLVGLYSGLQGCGV